MILIKYGGKDTLKLLNGSCQASFQQRFTHRTQSFEIAILNGAFPAVVNDKSALLRLNPIVLAHRNQRIDNKIKRVDFVIVNNKMMIG